MVMIESHDFSDADGYDASMIATSVTMDGQTDSPFSHRSYLDIYIYHFVVSNIISHCIPSMVEVPNKFSVVKPIRRDYDLLISNEFQLELIKKQLGMELRG